MAQSPVEFAVAFEKWRSRIATGTGGDDAVLSLIEFWPRLAQLGKNPAYSSYIAEYLAFLESLLRDGGIGDLRIDELRQLEVICLSLSVGEELTTSIRKQIARLCFYVGELHEGLQVCLRISNESLTLESYLDLDTSLSEIERFRILVDHVGDAAPNTKSLLSRLLNDWQSEREFVSTDNIHSLLVQHSSVGDRPRGKLRVLTGSIEERSSHSTNDEITFDNQLKAADDPIVSVAYHALAAIRSYFKATGYPKLGSQYYHAHLALAEREATYTGDSIGFATALLAYAQLLHTQALRHDHLLPGDIACTGGIDESGKVTPVNSDSLQAKVERVFFSHIKYLVLPAANLAQAQQYLDAILAQYPSRHLILLPVASLSAIVNDHNIVRPEKLCFGKVVAKSAVKYSRMTKVQVPMLAVLAYLLLCVIFPKAWVGFDWNPASVKVQRDSFVVLNKSGSELFGYESKCSPIDSLSVWTVGDLNGDEQNEVLLIPRRVDDRECRFPTHQHEFYQLICLDKSGNKMFSDPCVILGEFPSDSTQNQSYDVWPPMILKIRDRALIATSVSRSSPARNHFCFFGIDGKELGWFIDAGANFNPERSLAIDRNGNIAILGYNNKAGAASLAILNPDSIRSIAPPYSMTRRQERQERNLKAYFIFPRSDLNQALHVDYNYAFRIQLEPDGMLKAEIDESKGDSALVIYSIDQYYRLRSVSLSDHFLTMRKTMVDQKKLPAVEVRSYETLLTHNVLCWGKGEWVQAPSAPEAILTN